MKRYETVIQCYNNNIYYLLFQLVVQHPTNVEHTLHIQDFHKNVVGSKELGSLSGELMVQIFK